MLRLVQENSYRGGATKTAKQLSDSVGTLRRAINVCNKREDRCQYTVYICIAMYCHILPGIPMYCYVLQCIPMYCHVLQFIAK